METAVMLFTRDLRLHDNPALAAACAAAEYVVPLFVLDEKILAGPAGTPNKVRFLLDCLIDLDDSLRARGADLVLRIGDPVAETLRIAGRAGAQGVFMAADVSAYANRRHGRLAEACALGRMALSTHAGVTVVPPGAVTPVGGDHYRVFTPYWRAWSKEPRRAVEPAPERLRSGPAARPASWTPAEAPAALRTAAGRQGVGGLGLIPEAAADAVARIVPGMASPGLPPGGERAARARMRTWLAESLAGYEEHRDDLAGSGDGTSRLSPYLRFGCLSPLELSVAAGDGPGAEAFRRQLAWRDFHHQVTAAFPEIMRRDYRPRGNRWHADADALDAWRAGRTGYPIVDAGMRQLLHEGWMHNRARMITASFLSRRLHVDWRQGLRHFGDWLVDGDVPDNAGNWQWVAGTGNDTRPGRVLSPLRQADRFDPAGEYVRTHVPELAALGPSDVHRPWLLSADVRRALGYPAPLVASGEKP